MAKRRDPDGMRRLLERRRRQGLTWKELAATSGGPKSTLCQWQRVLRDRKARPARRRRFVELVASPAAPPSMYSS